MASKYKKVGADCWVHEDIGGVVFPQKPPDWIADYLVQIASVEYDRGESNAKLRLRHVLEEFGVVTTDDLPRN